MNKKILAGALVLGASTMFGLVGCGGDKDDKEPEIPKYSVTFDDDNEATEDTVVQFTKGDTTLSSIPACPEKDGFAGVWESFTLNDQDITVNAKYGDGTNDNPYMISNADQFANMIKFAGKTSRATEYSKLEDGSSTSYVTATESDATRMREFYKTCTVTYIKNGSNWKISDITVTQKMHFKLISDIDLSVLQGEVNGGQFIVFALDGAKEDGSNYKITGVDGNKFRNTAGAIFNCISGSEISNLDIELDKNMATLAGQVRANSDANGQKTTISNVTISSKNGEEIFMSSDDNNEGPFVNFVLGNATLNLEYCKNGVDICSTAAYFGVFVGGYAQTLSTVNFVECWNTGSIISSGKAGIFFGSDNGYTPTFTIQDCFNGGNITAYDSDKSHILVAQTSANPTINGGLIDAYDVDSDDFTQYGQISQLDEKYTLEVHPDFDENWLVASATKEQVDGGEEYERLSAGDYELILSGMANSTGFSIMINITHLKLNVTGTADREKDPMDYSDIQLEFQDVRHGMMDINTYQTKYSQAAIPADTSAEWNQLEGYTGIRYFLDTVNDYYVFDFSQYEEENSTSGIILNVAKDKVKAIVVVRDNNNDVINFVVG